MAVCRTVDVPRPRPGTGARLVVFCDQVRDPGNLGTVIRCADAFGADARADLDRLGRPVQPQDRPRQHRQHVPPADRGRGGPGRGGRRPPAPPVSRCFGADGAADCTVDDLAHRRRAGPSRPCGCSATRPGACRRPRRPAGPTGRAADVRPGRESQPVHRRRGPAVRDAATPSASESREQRRGCRSSAAPARRTVAARPHRMPDAASTTSTTTGRRRLALLLDLRPDAAAVADRVADGRLRGPPGRRRSARRSPGRRLTASLGGFGGLFGGGRPYAYRFRLLVYLAAAQAAAVFLGIWSGGDPWLAAVVVTVIAALATLFCNAFGVAARGVPDRARRGDRHRHGRPGGRPGPDLAAGAGRRRVRRSRARGARRRRPPFARTADRRGGGRGRRRLPRGDRRRRRGPGPPPGGRAAVRGRG